MESRSIQIQSSHNNKMSITIIPGHFATTHSHVNYYIDMTSIKHHHSMALQAAEAIVEMHAGREKVDTIICMDGCEIIGAFVAEKLSRAEVRETDINVVTPEFNSNGQLIFRDNLQKMIWGKNILLLVASATTGKTVNRSLECIKYYGGRVIGISAIFSAISEMGGVKISSIFTCEDLPNYTTYGFQECPFCREKQKIDAIVNSYGYSKI